MATEEYEAPPKLQAIPAASPQSATFVVSEEDHTLGNSLRYMLMRNSETQFCAYSVPHPSEALINIRLHTKQQAAIDVLRKGLQDLVDVSTHIEATFIRSCAAAGVALTADDMAGASQDVVAALESGAGASQVGAGTGVDEEMDGEEGKGKKKEKKEKKVKKEQ